jgi:uncharacterized HAD superfamily protein
MPKKLRIGIDFDDVLVDFNGGLTVYHHENYGTSYSKEDVTSWEYHTLWECSPEEALRRMVEYVHSSHHRRVPPVIGAVEAIKKLKEKNDLFIITARDENLSDQTFLLIKEHFPESFRGVHFLHKNSENILGDKGLVCTDLAIDIFIEDSLKNATHTGEAGVKTLLFDAPWNRINVLPENVKRVFSWEEIIREIEALEEN